MTSSKLATQERLAIIAQIRYLAKLISNDSNNWVIDRILKELDSVKDILNKERN